MQTPWQERGQTSSVAIQLLIGVVVIITGVIAVFAFGMVGGMLADSPSAAFDFQYDTETGEVVITMHSGQTIETEKLRVSGPRGEKTSWPVDELEAGDSIRFPAVPGDEITVGWTDAGKTNTKTLDTYEVKEQSRSFVAASWNREADLDTLSEFRLVFEETNNGLQWHEDAASINVSQAESGTSWGRYVLDLPANDGSMSVKLHFEGESFEDSGIKVSAVDANGNEHVIRCDESGNSFGNDIQISCPSGTNLGSSFTWDDTYTVSASSDLERFQIRSDMENVPETYKDSGKLYRIKVRLNDQ